MRQEFFEVLPPTIFFLISFNIVLIDRALMLRQYGLQLSSVAGASVLALLVANVVWKTVIYVLASLLLHYLEHLTPLWWRLGSFAAANDRLLEEMVWPHFWAIQLWLIVLIFVYCALRELVRVIGRDRVRDIFFRHPRVPLMRGA